MAAWGPLTSHSECPFSQAEASSRLLLRGSLRSRANSQLYSQMNPKNLAALSFLPSLPLATAERQAGGLESGKTFCVRSLAGKLIVIQLENANEVTYFPLERSWPLGMGAVNTEDKGPPGCRLPGGSH